MSLGLSAISPGYGRLAQDQLQDGQRWVLVRIGQVGVTKVGFAVNKTYQEIQKSIENTDLALGNLRCIHHKLLNRICFQLNSGDRGRGSRPYYELGADRRQGKGQNKRSRDLVSTLRNQPALAAPVHTGLSRKGLPKVTQLFELPGPLASSGLPKAPRTIESCCLRCPHVQAP